MSFTERVTQILNDSTQISELLGETSHSISTLTGGTVSLVYKVTLGDGRTMVLKFAEDFNELYLEQHFLKAWADVGIRTPQIHWCRVIEDGDGQAIAVLCMEFLAVQNLFQLMEADPVEWNAKWTQTEYESGKILAQMHSITGEGYGNPQVDKRGNVCGRYNTLVDQLADPEFQEAIQANVENGDLADHEVSLLTTAATLLEAESGTRSPSYTHNDFRAGNILYDPAAASPYAVIDPQPVFTHPYLCLAYSLILTEIHGRIDPSHFQRGYDEISQIDNDALRAAKFLCAAQLLPHWGEPGQQYAQALHRLFQREKRYLY